MTYSPDQIEVGKKLLKWLMNTMPEQMARREVVGLLKSNTVKDLNWAMKQSNATRLKNVKGMLKSRHGRSKNKV